MSAELLQRLVVLALVAGAAVYLARGAWRALRPRTARGEDGGGCDAGCGCSRR